MAHLQTTGRSEATPRHPAVAVADQPTFRQSSTEAPQLDPHGRSIDRDEHPVRSVLCRVNPAASRSAGPIMDRNHQPVRPALILALSRLLFGPMLQYMQTLPISKVKDKLNELVDAAASTREQVTITKNGSPAAVLIGVDEWESIQESLFWLSQPGIRESIAEAEADVEEGRVYSEEQIRAEFNVPKGDR
jgi:antitoxin YefM